MKEPEENDTNKVPGDNTNDSGHSEGYYDTRPDPNNEEASPKEEIPATEIPDIELEIESIKSHDVEIKRIVRRKSIVAFLVLIVMLTLFVLGFGWIIHKPQDNGVYSPLRKVFAFNEQANKVFYKAKHLAPTYPIAEAEKNPRVNGDLGMDTSFSVADWQLDVVNIDSHDTLVLNMDSIKKLPKTEVCFNFKCIEGWSQLTFWGGVKFSDFVKHYHLATRSHTPYNPDNTKDMAKYAGFQTPDDEYYVGLDIASALHPQTLLCYEMNGKPLPYDQGAPLRLIVPVKYGIKSLKRTGVIFFSDTRPADYWYEQGYDYDAAL